MAAYVGITGSPGTGKKTIAPPAASRLGLPSRSLNELALSFGLASKRTPEAEVDADELGRLVSLNVKGPCLLYGHLLPYSFRRGSLSRVVVLRCDPMVLGARLARRGYDNAKVVENVEAELIGVVAADSVKAFGPARVAEVDTTRVPVRTAAAEAARRLASGRGSQRIDWVSRYGSADKLRSLLGSKTFSART